MGALAGRTDVGAHRALAAGLDAGVGRLHEDREVAGEQLGTLAGEPAEPVELRSDLLALVEHVGDVADGLGDRRGHHERDRHAALHVARAQTVEDVALEPRRQVAVGGHGVKVPGDDDSLGTTERRTSDDRVAIAYDLEVRQRAQRRLDRVGDDLLVEALGGDVDERGGEADDVGGQVECGHGFIPPRGAEAPASLGREDAELVALGIGHDGPRPFSCGRQDRRAGGDEVVDRRVRRAASRPSGCGS